MDIICSKVYIGGYGLCNILTRRFSFNLSIMVPIYYIKPTAYNVIRKTIVAMLRC